MKKYLAWIIKEIVMQEWKNKNKVANLNQWLAKWPGKKFGRKGREV